MLYGLFSHLSALKMAQIIAYMGFLCCVIINSVDANILREYPKDCPDPSKHGYELSFPDDYNPMIPDFACFNDSAFEVELNFSVLQVHDIDDQRGDFKILLYVFASWPDSRIIKSPCPGVLPRDETLQTIWTPDFWIMLKKKLSIRFDGTGLNNFLVQNNRIVWYLEVDAIITCEMSFENFPFDNQYCYFWVGNVLAPVSVLKFTSHLTILDGDQKNLPYYLSYLPMNEDQKVQEGASICGFNIHLRRRVLPYLYSYFLPVSGFVVCSWISFVIPPTAIPGRMGFLVTLMLVLVNTYNTLNSSIGLITDATALGYFIGIAIGMLFAAILEYAAILTALPRLEAQKIRLKKQKKWNPNRKMFGLFHREPDAFSNQIDRLALFLFSLTYSLFIISYASYYIAIYYRDDSHLGNSRSFSEADRIVLF